MQVWSAVLKFFSHATTTSSSVELTASHLLPRLIFCPGYKPGVIESSPNDRFVSLFMDVSKDVTTAAEEEVVGWWNASTYTFNEGDKIHSDITRRLRLFWLAVVQKYRFFRGHEWLEVSVGPNPDHNVTVEELWTLWGKCYSLQCHEEVKKFQYVRLVLKADKGKMIGQCYIFPFVTVSGVITDGFYSCVRHRSRLPVRPLLQRVDVQASHDRAEAGRGEGGGARRREGDHQQRRVHRGDKRRAGVQRVQARLDQDKVHGIPSQMWKRWKLLQLCLSRLKSILNVAVCAFPQVRYILDADYDRLQQCVTRSDLACMVTHFHGLFVTALQEDETTGCEPPCALARFDVRLCFDP